MNTDQNQMNSQLSTPTALSPVARDLITDLLGLVLRVQTDERIDSFQGLTFNRDASVLVVHRWGSYYFESPAALVAWLEEPETRNPKPETEALCSPS